MSEYNQLSFVGGMNLLLDDTRLANNQYRVGFNVRNRYDVLDEVPNSSIDYAAPVGIKQEITTFGNYIILFVSGSAYYRAYDQIGWTKIDGFSMSQSAPRYWTVAVPVATTNYGRWAVKQTGLPVNSLAGVTSVSSIASQFGGNLPGLLVQDNINQPQFIYLNSNGYPVVRVTQTYANWSVDYDTVPDSPTYGKLTNDKREYVPVGNAMAWTDGILYIASQDGNSIYRSVSGRPLDFVINVDIDGNKGGDATTTSYSVGVGGISCLKAMNDGTLFVAASNSNFIVSKNMTPNAPTMFGEYLFIRKFLFEATCLNDRCIIDTLGDTRFIDLTGVRSFNAVQQAQNEGRNTPFTATIASAFKGITQSVAAAILYDNYEMYALSTTYGNVIAVYDTINGCWTSFDNAQVDGKAIKQFAKIELGVQRLFAITDDDSVYTLYSASDFAEAVVVTPSISANALADNTNVRLNNPKSEIKIADFRCILNRIRQDCKMTISCVINNRLSALCPASTKQITYSAPKNPYVGNLTLPDINTQLNNLYFTIPNVESGWKVSVIITWTGGGSLTQFAMSMNDYTPLNPLGSQGTTK